MPLHILAHLRKPYVCAVRTACLCAVLALASCTSGVVKRSALACPLPDPPPACSPSNFSTVTYDTSSARFPHWTIARVQGASSERTQEWGLIPVTPQHDLLLAGANAGDTRYNDITRTKPYRVESPPSRLTSERVLLTHVQPGNIMGDASLAYMSFKSDPPIVVELLAAPYNVPVFWDGHPATSSDGKVVVFASDRTDALGGTDLWWYVKTPSGVSIPRRLGIEVNTPCDELSPRFGPGDTVLLFASAGHATNGGYDLFSAPIKQMPSSISDTFLLAPARNIGLPVNTPADELFPFMPDNETLYYGSNQESVSDFDVFVLYRKRRAVDVEAPLQDTTPIVETPPIVDVPPPDRTPIPKATVTGRVVNQQTNEPIRDAQVTARDDSTKQVLDETRTDTSGTYVLKVPVDRPIEVSAQTPELFFDSYVVQVPKRDSGVVVRRDAAMEIPLSLFLRVNFPTSIYKDPYPKTLDSNGNETEQDWQSAIDLVAANVKQAGGALKRLVLIGHTDDVDTEESNIILGKNRVTFVINELVKRGVAEELLEGRSAGERLTLSKRKDESVDQWRKRCRRVELVKVMR
ncbi:MAG: hypothetical protein SGJ05_05515 [bacterium]|nr:hypothetical protein [bacterium]